MMRSDIRIGPDLLGATRVRHGTAARIADLLGVFPQITRGEIHLARRPGGAALVELGLVELNLERALLGVDRDDVAVAQQPDRAAHGRFRPDMANAESARG